jgi:hypothetical protein
VNRSAVQGAAGTNTAATLDADASATTAPTLAVPVIAPPAPGIERLIGVRDGARERLSRPRADAVEVTERPIVEASGRG